MNTYKVTVIGPNGNGLYEPTIKCVDDGVYAYELTSRNHPSIPYKRFPQYLLEDLLEYLNEHFAFNYSVNITYYPEDAQ